MSKVFRIISCVIVFILMLCASTACAEITSGKIGDINWKFKGGTLTISGTGPMEELGRYEYPWNMQDRKSTGWHILNIEIEDGVTTVGQHAFCNIDTLINVILPSSIKSIGTYAFCSCNNLKTISIPKGVDIGANAFLGCTNLEGYSELSSITLSTQDEITETAKNNPGVLQNLDFELMDLSGFTCPVFYHNNLESATIYTGDNGYREMKFDDSRSKYGVYGVSNRELHFFENLSDAELAEHYCHDLMDGEYPIKQEKFIHLDGHLARLTVYNAEGHWMNRYYSTGQLQYYRNDQYLRIKLYSKVKDNCVTMSDLEKVAEHISYNPSNAFLRSDDVELTIKTADNALIVPAGRKIQFTAEHKNTEKTNKNIKIAKKHYSNYYKDIFFTWHVIDNETGEVASDMKIDEKGSLTIDKTINSIRTVEIRAESRLFYTKAVYPLTVVPVSSSIRTEPSEVFFYVGSDTPQSVKAILEPETVPPIGLTWEEQKHGIVEVSEVEDGVVSIKPIATGKTVITVTDPNGKKSKLNVSIIEPVESIELKLSGKQTPGGKVSVKETLLPNNAGNKKVEWSLNVDESIATINEKGQIIINRDATVGTKIVVTCKALGAPEPVVSIIEFEVTEK